MPDKEMMRLDLKMYLRQSIYWEYLWRQLLLFEYAIRLNIRFTGGMLEG